MIKIVYRSSCEVPVILVRFELNLSFIDVFSKNTQIPNFKKIHSVGTEMFYADGQTDGNTHRRTDMTKLIVAFRNSANAPRNVFFVHCSGLCPDLNL
jgi:hypothetical protein